ncbi:hypothetical protein KQX54_008609 [Cotesia glomerata]|uniref:Uncharacterized protein n=1 Tax=Cotesia glomerata TaxID=32391 RepID=A0AAV7I8D0_COTGL|nr:hypothetical protein KQX54_008609 [Cotesia glomerata]
MVLCVYSYDGCVNYGDTCDPNDGVTCCDEKSTCKQTSSNNSFVCINEEKFLKTCNTDADCKMIQFAVCSSDKKCTCKNAFTEFDETRCTTKLGKICCDTDNECPIEFSVCKQNKCQCKLGYLNVADKQCVLVESPSRSCYNNDPNCRLFTIAKLLPNRQYVCTEYRAKINSTACTASSGESCTEKNHCVSKYSVCINNKCQCKFEYVSHSSIDCPSLTRSRFCRADRDCLDLGNSRCSLNEICVCKHNNFALNNHTCYPILNGVCSYDEECEKNFHCVDFTCQCQPFFSSVSVHECRESDLLYSCNDNSECSDPWHANCSKNKKCVCNINNIAVSNTTCLPILDGYCWQDDQCMVGNSICEDFRCKCRPNYVAIADNLCSIKN